MKNLLLLAMVLLMPIAHFAQEGDMYPVSLQQRVDESSVVIEGKIISQQSLWDTSRKNIYTIHEVEVYKTFKGTTATKTVQVATLGGRVDDFFISVTSEPEFLKGDTGIFILKQSTTNPLPNFSAIYTNVAAAQGFIAYNSTQEKASDIFNQYESIQNELYQALEKSAGQKHQKIQQTSLFETKKSRKTGTSTQKSLLPPPTITDFTPMTISAGNNQILTVNGTGFETSGTIAFKDANDGGASFYDAGADEIVSWSDTQIQVQVPARAGTGTIKITNGSGEVTSTQTVTISYARINLANKFTTLIEDNGTDGFVFNYAPSFQGAAAIPDFEDAMSTWSCYSGVNFTIGGTTALDEVAFDGVNIVRFGNLPMGVLGRVETYGYFSCGETYYVGELDVTFTDSPSLDWYNDPSNFDFKSVAIHEMGHAHQLGHVIDFDDPMHFGTTGIPRHFLSQSNQDGADNAMADFILTPACGGSAMTPINSVSISIQPADYNTCLGTDALFSIVADGVGGYQWQRNTGGGWIDLTDGATTTGATLSNLTDAVSNATQDGHLYRCKLTDPCGTETFTNEVTLGVTASPTSVITPTNATCEISNGKLTVTLPVVMGQPTYEFSTDNGSTYPHNFNADGSTAEITGLAADTYAVWVRWSNDACAVDLGNHIIGADTAPISMQPIAQNICSSETANFSVIAPGANAWQWQMDVAGTWTDITAPTNNTANLSYEPTTSTMIRCELMDSCGNTYYSDVVALNVKTAPTASVTKTDTSCGEVNGTLTFAFSDAANQTAYEFSIDNGSTYPHTYADTEGMATLTDIAPGDYDVWVRWGDDECPVSLGSYQIGASQNPEASVEVTPIQCGVTTGSLSFNFTDAPDQSTIEFSINGGLSFDYSYNDSAGSATVNNLAEGTYDVQSRWPDGTCLHTLGQFNIAQSTEQPNLITQDITVQLDASGNVDILATDLDNGSTSTCGFTSVVADKTAFDCDEVGDNTITLTFTETGGRMTTATTTVTVEDPIAPEVITQDITVSLDINNMATVLPSDVIASSSDNCSIASTTLDISDFNASNLGPNTVTITATDTAGNTNIQTAIVTVEDMIAPVIVLQGDNPLELTIGNGYLEPGATSDDGSEVIVDTSDFQDALGTYTIRYNATDASGNMAVEVTRQVTVVERCPLFELPADNFEIIASSETCNGNSNGSIQITANKILDYTLTISGTDYTFTKDFKLEDLTPGNYSVCIGLEEYADCESCFDLRIEAGPTVSGKTSFVSDKNSNTVAVQMESGTAPFTVLVNNIEVAEFHNTDFEVKVKNGDHIAIRSSIACEGKVALKIDLFQDIRAYPNPTYDVVEIDLTSFEKEEVVIDIQNTIGVLLNTKKHKVRNGKVLVSLTDLPSGTYYLRVNSGISKILKIIKR